MLKPASLRDHLTNLVPFLAADPERLKMQVTKGRVACPYTGSLSYQYAYDLQLLIEDYPAHIDSVIVPILAWLAVNQPDHLLNPATAEEAIPFEADLIDHERTDLLITLALTESVAVTLAAGTYTATHIAEPTLPDLGGPAGWEMIAAEITAQYLRRDGTAHRDGTHSRSLN